MSAALSDQPATIRPTIWVVDDSPLDAERAASVLGDRCSVRLFGDGSAALERLSSERPPDLLILDWVMPSVSGIEVVQYVRSEPELSQVPILLVTVQDRPEQIAQGLAAGANDYVGKPFAPEELRARVDALLRSSRLLTRALAAEKTVRQLLASAPDALIAIDAQGRITFANAEAERLLGMCLDDMMGREIEELISDLPLRNILVGSGESLLPLPDVRIGDKILSPSARILPTDTAASTTIALRDVTDRRQAEERRLDFYSIIAHDLRSPLSAMMLRTELMLRGQRGPLSAQMVADIHKFSNSLRSMIGMINDFLDLARLEGMGHKIDRSELDLSNIVASTVDELRPLADAGRLTLDWSPPAEQACVYGDRPRLTQVLSNLIGNGIKFTPPGGTVSIQISVLDDVVETCVSDTGPGVPAEFLPVLFKRFTRSSTSPAVGSGLGLMIVREIVEAHGGNVGVTTELGKGSTFWFRLPKVVKREASSPSNPRLVRLK